jgi:hypothetical protein
MVKLRRTVVFAGALAIPLEPSAAQEQAARAPTLVQLPASAVRARPAGARDRIMGVVLTLPNARAVPVRLSGVTEAWNIDSVRVLAAGRRGGTTYVLLDVMGPSRSPNGGRGLCGAGTERGLVALALAHGPGSAVRVARLSGAVHESCFFTINQDDPQLVVTRDSVRGPMTPYPPPTRDGQQYRRPSAIDTMRYVYAYPERGIHPARPR